jgi:hypothetical protein
MNEEFDIGEGAAAPDSLAQLRKLLEEGIALQTIIKQQEADLKAAKAAFQSLVTGRIPDAMAEIQSGHFTFKGWEVAVADFVSGSLPKEPEARQKAIDLLEAYGAEGLIKTEVKIEFGKSQHNEAMSVAGELKERGYPVDANSGVNSQSLCKFARDRIASGEPIDTEALGLYTGRVAKFKELK